MKPKIFVAQPIPEAALDIMREVAEVEVFPYFDRQIGVPDLAAGAKRSDWLFVLHETHVNAEVLAANPKLKGVAAMARDPDIDVAAATKLGIPVIIDRPISQIGQETVHTATADLTMGMLLGLAYRLVESDVYTRTVGFRQEQTAALMGLGCWNKTVGLIGLGKVARHMVPRLKPFGMNVIYTKRSRLPAAEEKDFGIEWVAELDELLKRSDYVCVLCDYNTETHKLIGRRELDLIGPDGYLINTGRGRIVDEPEMILALQEKRIAGAALDVFWDEPPHTVDPFVPDALKKLDNVILAPHNGGATISLRTERTSSVARDLVMAIKGEWPPAILNPEVLAQQGLKVPA
ncbi:glyoxylate reductase [Terrihabitans soli]|uniref:Glyoxylate reductase n=1 Tax=Terrihabitans soli TaxID=708113 RepID=A0A6S6QNY9_9HYPH|nr:NAD(P)-dependent oxidoreductase [Terrihabitans soli]BCJ89627.1 glyoxylate reductase [Terrihabitans soli]